MENVTEKQLGLLLWLTTQTGLTSHLKPHSEDVEGRVVDYTQDTFIKWCRANISQKDMSHLLTNLTMVNDCESELGSIIKFLNEQGYECK